MAAPTAANPNPIFARIYSLTGVDDCKAVYEDWADEYDNDVNDPSQDYVGPIRVAKAVVAAGGNLNGTVIDAGCGTGLCGVALAKCGARVIDGVDLSPGMIRVAGKTGVYRNLTTADLSKPMDKPDATYDVVTCVGTLTKSHVDPQPALPEFVRITKKGGIIAATVLEDIWVPGGYKAECERLRDLGLVTIESTDLDAYRANLQARVVVLKKQ